MAIFLLSEASFWIVLFCVLCLGLWACTAGVVFLVLHLFVAEEKEGEGKFSQSLQDFRAHVMGESVKGKLQDWFEDFGESVISVENGLVDYGSLLSEKLVVLERNRAFLETHCARV